MFRDTEKELARLEAELLAEEETIEEMDENYHQDPEEPEEAPVIERYRVYNTDITDEDLEAYAEAVRTPGKGGLSGFLVVLLCLLTLGIVALVALYLYQEGLL